MRARIPPSAGAQVRRRPPRARRAPSARLRPRRFQSVGDPDPDGPRFRIRWGVSHGVAPLAAVIASGDGHVGEARVGEVPARLRLSLRLFSACVIIVLDMAVRAARSAWPGIRVTILLLGRLIARTLHR